LLCCAALLSRSVLWSPLTPAAASVQVQAIKEPLWIDIEVNTDDTFKEQLQQAIDNRDETAEKQIQSERDNPIYSKMKEVSEKLGMGPTALSFLSSPRSQSEPSFFLLQAAPTRSTL
jgi:hypothetical protein